MKDKQTGWNFFSNDAHVLVSLAENPHARLRDVAEKVGITERTAVRLITKLDKAGILKRVKEGRRNRYIIDVDQPLRHPIESHCSVGALLAMILEPARVRQLKRELADYRKDHAR